MKVICLCDYLNDQQIYVESKGENKESDFLLSQVLLHALGDEASLMGTQWTGFPMHPMYALNADLRILFNMRACGSKANELMITDRLNLISRFSLPLSVFVRLLPRAPKHLCVQRCMMRIMQ